MVGLQCKRSFYVLLYTFTTLILLCGKHLLTSENKNVAVKIHSNHITASAVTYTVIRNSAGMNTTTEDQTRITKLSIQRFLDIQPKATKKSTNPRNQDIKKKRMYYFPGIQDASKTANNTSFQAVKKMKPLTINIINTLDAVKIKKTLHIPNLINFCKQASGRIVLPSQVASRGATVTRTCSMLRKAIPLMRRRQPSQAQLFRLRWDRLRHVLYCPVPQVGPGWARHMLEPFGVTNFSITRDRLDDLLQRYLPPPSREELLVSPLRDNLKVLVASHPFRRLEAAYQMTVREANYTVTSATSVTGQKPLIPSFQDFCRHVLDTTEKWLASPHLPPPDERWMPVTFLCAPCIIDYDIISDDECVESDTRIIKEHCHQWSPAMKNSEYEEKAAVGSSGDKGATARDELQCKASSFKDSDSVRGMSRDRSNSRDSFRNIRGLFSQLTTDELNRLYNIYKYDFQAMGYSKL